MRYYRFAMVSEDWAEPDHYVIVRVYDPFIPPREIESSVYEYAKHYFFDLFEEEYLEAGIETANVSVTMEEEYFTQAESDADAECYCATELEIG